MNSNLEIFFNIYYNYDQLVALLRKRSHFLENEKLAYKNIFLLSFLNLVILHAVKIMKI